MLEAVGDASGVMAPALPSWALSAPNCVNTIGLPLYAKQELMRMNKGVALEAQSNPLNLCTKPRAVIKLTK